MKCLLRKLFASKRKDATDTTDFPKKKLSLPMDTVKFQNNSVKLIAHRGLSGIEAENSIAAFVAAGNRNYYGIETDVHKTKDGNYVVIHDSTTGRVAEKNIPVVKRTLSDLQRLRLKDKDGLLRSDLTIPTLQEYIAICKRYGKEVVLELKHGLSDSDIEKIIQILTHENYLEQTIFISFTLNYLIHIRSLLPNQKLQYLVTECSQEVMDDLVKHHLDIDIHYPSLTLELVRKLKSNHIKINCWTCDNANDANHLASLGVDYITTNILE